MREVNLDYCQLKAAIESADIGVWVNELSTRHETWNDSIWALYQIDRAVRPSKEQLQRVIHPDDLNLFTQTIEDVIKSKSTRSCSYRICVSRDQIRHISGKIGVCVDDNNDVVKVFGINQDVTQRVRVQNSMERQRSLLKAVIDSIPDIIFYKNYSETDGVYTGCNKAFFELVGKQVEDIVGSDDIDIFGMEVGDAYREADIEIMESKQSCLIEEWATYPNQKKVFLHLLKTPLYDSDNNMLGVLGIGRDHTEQWRLKEGLEKLSNTDELTRLYNRRGFFKSIENTVKMSCRYNKNFVIGILDLDHFKRINDKLGHNAGDEVLKHTAKVLKQIGRKTDRFARYGGEEFIFSLPETNLAEAVSIAQRIREAISNTVIHYQEMKISVNVSIGLCALSSDNDTIEKMIMQADRMLYQAKESGRNRVCS